MLRNKQSSATLFYKAATADSMWDTWLYYESGTFYLYYLVGPMLKWNGVGMATSHDGVHWKEIGKILEAEMDSDWLGSGSVWAVSAGSDGSKTFIMNFSEWRGSKNDGRQTIFFAESQDLVHWKRLSPEYEFRQDTRWYEPKGRWDCISTLHRSEGGYYGYWTANPKNGKAGLGFGESLDGVVWRALEPAALPDFKSAPEAGAARGWRNKFYAIVSPPDANWSAARNLNFVSGLMTTVIGNSPSGPFRPAPNNPSLLIGNASYFCRFLDTPDGTLVNHHSWEIEEGQPMGVTTGHVYMAPLKRAMWDEDGTLRLMWWEGNNQIKGEPLRVELAEAREWKTPLLLNNLTSEEKKTIILEGVIVLPGSMSAPSVGLYLQGSGDKGTAFLLQRNGIVMCGSMSSDGAHFENLGNVDRKLTLQHSTPFRLIRRDRITEFYVNDVLMQCYCLPEQGTGKIGLIGARENFKELMIWHF